MAIAVKAVFSYSATAAFTTAWTVTASTSIAVGDTLVFAVDWISSTSGSASTPVDNAGNVWTLVASQNQTGHQKIWIAPVTTTTANFQIAIGTQFSKTVSARAAHILVLSGAHATSPLDTGSVFVRADAAGSTATYTLSTSVTTTTDAGMLIAVAAANTLPGSASFNADAAWTPQGNSIAVTGTVAFKRQIWTRAISTPAIYNFSASLSTGGNTHVRRGVIFAVRSAPTGSASGTATITFADTATLRGDASASGSATFTFGNQATLTAAGTDASASGTATITFADAATLRGAGSLSGSSTVVFGQAVTLTGRASASGSSTITFADAATLVGRASASGSATFTFGQASTLIGQASASGSATVQFGQAATLTGAASLSGTATVVFGSQATLTDAGGVTDVSASGTATLAFGSDATLSGVTATASAAVAQYSAGGGSWDPHSFRRFLLARKRDLKRTAAAIANEAEDTPQEARAERLETRVEAIAIPDLGAVIAMQAAAARLAAMETELQRLAAALQRHIDDEDDDDILAMVA